MGHSGVSEGRDQLVRSTDTTHPLRTRPPGQSDPGATPGGSGAGGEGDAEDPAVAEPGAAPDEAGDPGEDHGLPELPPAPTAPAAGLRAVHGRPVHRQNRHSLQTAVCLSPDGMAEMNIITVLCFCSSCRVSCSSCPDSS